MQSPYTLLVRVIFTVKKNRDKNERYYISIK